VLDYSIQGSYKGIPKTMKTKVFMPPSIQLHINYIFKHHSPLKDKFHNLGSPSIP